MSERCRLYLREYCRRQRPLLLRRRHHRLPTKPSEIHCVMARGAGEKEDFSSRMDLEDPLRRVFLVFPTAGRNSPAGVCCPIPVIWAKTLRVDPFDFLTDFKAENMAQLSVNINELEWVTRNDGVSQATIYEEGGFFFSLIRVPPNTTLPKHGHPENEYVFIQEGVLYEDGHPLRAGTFLLNAKGSYHSTSTRDQGCTLLALWCGRLDYEGPAE